MASNFKKYIFAPLVDGVNDTDDDSLIKNTQASLARNVDFDADGPKTAKRYTKYNTNDFDVNEVKTMLEYQKDGTKQLLVVSNNTLKKQVDGTSFSDIGAVATGNIEGININCAFYTNPTTETVAEGDKLLTLDGTNYKYYNGTTYADVPTYTPTTEQQANPGSNILVSNPNEIKQAKYIQLYQNRVWTAKGRNLRFSDVQTAGGYVGNYFPATYVFSFPLDITSLIIDRKPIVFTDQKAYMISGSTAQSTHYDAYRYIEIPVEKGTTNHRTVKVTNTGVIYLHRKGVYRLVSYGDNYICQKISKGEGLKSESKIEKFIESKTDEQIQSAFAVLGNDKYLLMFDDGTAAIFNLTRQNWTIYDNLKGNCGINLDGKVLIGKQYIYEMYKGLNDDGETFTALLDFKNSNQDLVSMLKDYDSLIMSFRSDLNSYTVYVSVDMDFITVTIDKPIECRISRWGEMRFGDVIRTTDVTLNRDIPLSKSDDKYSMKIKLKSNGLNHQWHLLNTILEYKAKEMSS